MASEERKVVKGAGQGGAMRIGFILQGDGQKKAHLLAGGGKSKNGGGHLKNPPYTWTKRGENAYSYKMISMIRGPARGREDSSKKV